MHRGHRGYRGREAAASDGTGHIGIRYMGGWSLVSAGLGLCDSVRPLWILLCSLDMSTSADCGCLAFLSSLQCNPGRQLSTRVAQYALLPCGVFFNGVARGSQCNVGESRLSELDVGETRLQMQIPPTTEVMRPATSSLVQGQPKDHPHHGLEDSRLQDRSRLI